MKVNYDVIKNIVLDTIKLIGLFIVRLFVKEDPLCWVISERGYEAKDNAYFFFRWLLRNHPEYDIKYIISPYSADLNKFIGLEKHILYRDSLQHYKYLWRAKYLVSTHVVGFKPPMRYFYELDLKLDLFKHKVKVFLQHGVTYCFHRGLCSDKVNIDLFICGSKIEHDFVLGNFGFTSDVVKYTGLCRFDNLHDADSQKQIVVMPTWRMYLDPSNFHTSDYYKHFAELLNNKKLHDLLLKNGYKLVFYPHWEMQAYIDYFKRLPLPDYITIADCSYDVQTLLKESSLMVTDYSSVAFDMLYMRKPVVYFQFDSDRFFKNHYEKPYFDYSEFSDICNDGEIVIELIKSYIGTGCRLKEEHSKFIDKFFPLYDNRNSERVYNEIIRK